MSSPAANSLSEMSTPVDINLLRRERLQRLRSKLAESDCAGAVFFDPINIRYATDLSNMQVWCLHNPARYTFIATSGPVIAFEFPSCGHLAEAIEVIDEVRPACTWHYAQTYLCQPE